MSVRNHPDTNQNYGVKILNKKKTIFIVEASIIGAVYASLTYLSSVFGIAYMGIQFRFSEALTILACLTPSAIPGLTIGCFIGNLGSPYGIIDIICGTIATLLASILSYKTRHIKFKELPILSPIFPIIINAIIVGAEVTIYMPKGFLFEAFLLNASQIALSQLVMCYGIGLPLYNVLKKMNFQKNF